MLTQKLNITNDDEFISIECNILFKCAMAAYQVCLNTLRRTFPCNNHTPNVYLNALTQYLYDKSFSI